MSDIKTTISVPLPEQKWPNDIWPSKERLHKGCPICDSAIIKLETDRDDKGTVVGERFEYGCKSKWQWFYDEYGEFLSAQDGFRYCPNTLPMALTARQFADRIVRCGS